MNLKRQLLLVSVLTLMLPWAGCEFIRETESALRTVQQNMLAGTARAHAITMAQYIEEFPPVESLSLSGDAVYQHALRRRPQVNGYFDDWPLAAASLTSLHGSDGPVRYAVGTYSGDVFLYVEVADRNVVYATAETMILDDGPEYADRVSLISDSPPYLREQYIFAAEAPGPIVSYKQDKYGFAPEPAISAHWQDIPGGYRIEARIPADRLGTNLGIVVSNTAQMSQRATRISSYSGDTPESVTKMSPELNVVATKLAQENTRLLVTDAAGWRLASAGQLSAATTQKYLSSGWPRRIYDLLVESGREARFAQPDPLGRERQAYVSAALDGRETPAWFRSDESGRAIVAVAAPIINDGEVIGALILQQGTEAILSLTNARLAALIKVTLIATLLVAGTLLGYATWLSRRIRYLSLATEDALEKENLHAALPSALAVDEIGDLSRSFSFVMQQLGDYNAYLRSLASKLSHELRTPLAIVTSSLENLEHEPLSEASLGYTERAREGAERLRHILNAMSEASRVEALMENAEAEPFDLRAVLNSTTEAYRDVYNEREFEFKCSVESAPAIGSPELLIQMLDKLVDNAVDFSQPGDAIQISLGSSDEALQLSVTNPGPPLPERMRTQMFDSMVSMRGGENSRHLGLGLYIARLIAEGHGGRIEADNVEGGVEFSVFLPKQ